MLTLTLMTRVPDEQSFSTPGGSNFFQPLELLFQVAFFCPASLLGGSNLEYEIVSK